MGHLPVQAEDGRETGGQGLGVRERVAAHPGLVVDEAFHGLVRSLFVE